MLKRKDMLNLPIKFGAFTSQMREIEILFTKYNRIVVKEIYDRFINTSENRDKFGSNIVSYQDFKKDILRKHPRKLKNKIKKNIKNSNNQDGSNNTNDIENSNDEDETEMYDKCCIKVHYNNEIRRCKNNKIESEDFCHCHIHFKNMSVESLPFGRFD